jgi:hypothetical protein
MLLRRSGWFLLALCSEGQALVRAVVVAVNMTIHCDCVPFRPIDYGKLKNITRVDHVPVGQYVRGCSSSPL